MGLKPRVEYKVPRRTFLGFLGWASLALTGVLSALGSLFYLRPAVSYGPPRNFKIGRPQDYPEGTRITFDDKRVAIVREGNNLFAISTTCTHLGCVVSPSETGFNCPCHGSRYDEYGNVIGGPAPKPLPWFAIDLTPTGELEVDKAKVVAQKTFFSVA